jgi:hypothetical protein
LPKEVKVCINVSEYGPYKPLGFLLPLSESLEQGQPLGYGFFTHFQNGTERLREERNILARVSEMDRNLRRNGIRGLKFWILGQRKVFCLFWLGWNRTHNHELFQLHKYEYTTKINETTECKSIMLITSFWDQTFN